MAFITRRRTIGKAMELLRDLQANTAHPDKYHNESEFAWDAHLKGLLQQWLVNVETQDEA